MDREEKMSRVLRVLKDLYGAETFRLSGRRPNLFEILITAVLSHRTRDENTDRAAENLFSIASGPEDVLKLGELELQGLIKPSGFYRQKAKKIREVCEILLERHGGRVPVSRGELLALPGVGPKTADVVLCYGLGRPTIPVDVHVEVCSKRLGLVRKEAKYEEMRETLESLTPEEERYTVNLGFVKFGRDFCRTRFPRCSVCPMKDLCEYPSGDNPWTISPSER